MPKKKKAEIGGNRNQPENKPRKGSASRKIAASTQSVKHRLWVVMTRPVGLSREAPMRVFTKERDARTWFIARTKADRRCPFRRVLRLQSFVAEVSDARR
jgi:hypothetical protein